MFCGSEWLVFVMLRVVRPVCEVFSVLVFVGLGVLAEGMCPVCVFSVFEFMLEWFASGVSVKIWCSLFISSVCVVVTMGMVPSLVGCSRMRPMSLSAAVILLLSLGKGKCTLVGSQVRVSAILVARVSGLKIK